MDTFRWSGPWSTPGAEVKLADKFGRTALIAAAETGQVEIVQTLIKAGADIEATSRSSGTALFAAAHQGHVDAAKHLLDAGADTDPRDLHQRTPLMAAAVQGHVAVMELLLGRGASAQMCNRDGMTAFDYAVRQSAVHAAAARHFASPRPAE